MKTLNPEDWTDWWNKGGITSFATGFDNNYDGEILDFWSKSLDTNASITLDLCCGNGALSWIAYDIINDKTPAAPKTILGVDIADIEPFKLLSRHADDYPGLQFVGNTPLESLPFEDNYADQAISQYGLEYSDLSQTIPELSRVLKTKATIGFIMHDSNSIILRDSIKTVEKYSYFLKDAKLFDLFKKLDKVHSSHGSADSLANDPRRKKLMKRINEVIREGLSLHDEAADDPSKAVVNNFLFEVTRLFTNPQINGSTRKEKLAEYKCIVETTILRSTDLISAALSDEDFDNLINLLKDHHFELNHNGPILYKGRNYGRALLASR